MRFGGQIEFGDTNLREKVPYQSSNVTVNVKVYHFGNFYGT